MSDLLHAAEQYREIGWQLVPVVGKKPRLSWKTPPSWDKMTPFWDDPETTGLAVILGAPSGDLVVRDFDKSGAFDRWKLTSGTATRGASLSLAADEERAWQAGEDSVRWRRA